MSTSPTPHPSMERSTLYLYRVLQMAREKSGLQGSTVVKPSERRDPSGVVKQTASGRIELRLTNNFSLTMDKERFREMRQKITAIEPIMYVTSGNLTPCPLPSNRQHLSYGDCLEGKRGDDLTSSVLLCIIIVHIATIYLFSLRKLFPQRWFCCLVASAYSVI